MPKLRIKRWKKAVNQEKYCCKYLTDKLSTFTIKNKTSFAVSHVVIETMATVYILACVSTFFPLYNFTGYLICLFFGVSFFVNVIMYYSIVEFVGIKCMTHYENNVAQTISSLVGLCFPFTQYVQGRTCFEPFYLKVIV